MLWGYTDGVSDWDLSELFEMWLFTVDAELSDRVDGTVSKLPGGLGDSLFSEETSPRLMWASEDDQEEEESGGNSSIGLGGRSGAKFKGEETSIGSGGGGGEKSYGGLNGGEAGGKGGLLGGGGPGGCPGSLGWSNRCPAIFRTTTVGWVRAYS